MMHMPSMLAPPLDTRRTQDRLAGGKIRRTAFYLESEGETLFAWLHLHEGTTATHGILICQPLGHEQVHAHRTLRHLADTLAAQGFAVLRPDYHGTGDSDGVPQDPDRRATWLANLRDAAGWLRKVAGCEKVSLIGLRLGATLAALHAAGHEVENLVLWAPVVNGRRYARELRALSLAAREAKPDAPSIEAAGFVHARDTVEELAETNLLTVATRCRNALIVEPPTGPGEKRLQDHLAANGAEAERITFSGYEEMMAEPHETRVPHEVLQEITAWMLAKGSPAESAAPGATDFPSAMVTAAFPPVRESAHRISSAPDLFAIATEPLEGTGRLPWIVMLNAGAAYRIGPGRLHVGLARYLAALGFRSLRLDIGGLGDSAADSPEAENDAYAATAFRDVAITFDYLRKLQPGCSIVLMGLCSGAYTAFQSAAQLPHPALVESILINPLTFFWQEGMRIADGSPTESLRHWHYYWKAVTDPRSWRLLLSGKTDDGIKGTIRRFWQKVAPKFSRPAGPAPKMRSPHPPSGWSHPARKDLASDLGRVAAHSRHLSLFVSDNDPGHFLLMCGARRRATQLIRGGRLQCHFISDADHTFSTEQSRQRFTQLIADHLRGRYGRMMETV